MAITPPDIVISLILVFFTFNGFRHGFIEEMGRLISLIGGFILASKFHNLLIPYLKPYIDGETIQVTVAYLGVFIVSIIVITIIFFCFVSDFFNKCTTFSKFGLIHSIP